MAKLSCGIDSDEVLNIISGVVKNSKRLLTKDDFKKEIATYKYKDTKTNLYRNFDDSELNSIVDASYKRYIEEMEKSIKSEKSPNKDKQISHLKTISNLESINSYEKEMERKLENAYRFVGAEREKRLEEINGDIEKLKGDTSVRTLKENMWAIPLTSTSFLLGNVVSNLQQILLSNITNKIHKSPKELRDIIGEYGKSYRKDVLNGGIALQTIIQAETGSDGYNALERKDKSKFLSAWTYIGKISNRINNFLDSGLAPSMELFYYKLLRNEEEQLYKVTNNKTKLTEDDNRIINENTYKKMYGENTIEKSYENAEKLTEQAFQDAGYTVDAEFKKSAQYKRQVYEKMRSGNYSPVVKSVSTAIALETFFKRNMREPKDRIDYVSGGIMQFPVLFTRWLGDFTQKAFPNDNTKASLFGETIKAEYIGYINGAMNFIESSLEYSMVYGGLKYLALKSTNAKDYEKQLYKDEKLVQLQTKIVLGTVLSALATVVMKAINEVACEDEIATSTITDNSTAMYICGTKVPSWLFGSYAPNIIMFDTAYQLFLKDKDIANFNRFMFFMSIITANKFVEGKDNSILGKLKEYMSKSGTEKEKAGDSFIKSAVGEIVGVFVKPFNPVPSALGDVVQSIYPQKKAEKGIDFDEGFIPSVKDLSHYALWSLSKEFYVSEIISTTTSEENVYDYFGRPLLNFRAESSPFPFFSARIQGKSIKYDKYDDMVNTSRVGVRELFDSRQRLLFSREKEKRRYMTDKEFSLSRQAGGQVFREWIVENYESLKNSPDKNDEIQKKMVSIESATLNVVEENTKLDLESYKKYIKRSSKK